MLSCHLLNCLSKKIYNGVIIKHDLAARHASHMTARVANQWTQEASMAWHVVEVGRDSNATTI